MISLLTLSQSIISAHTRSFERQEELLRELREQPKRFLDVQHYEQRHTDLERRVNVLEEGFHELTRRIQELPDLIFQRLEQRSSTSRGQWITIFIAIFNAVVLIVIALAGYLHR